MRYYFIWVALVAMSISSVAQENRSINGQGNNLLHPDWNSKGALLSYPTSLDYADEVSAPNDINRPNPREVSNILFTQLNTTTNQKALSDYIWVFGQFIDHDISIVDDEHNSFMPITVPEGDEYFTPGSLIPMSRSLAVSGTGTSVDNPRKVANAITGWIDASSVYGSAETTAFWLRTFAKGKLKTSIGNFLPFNTINGELNTNLDNIAPEMANPTGISDKYFVAGDVRANENSLLLCLHTIFLREHNRLCDEAIIEHPEWSDEQLYQYARKKVGAYIQSIAYNEWLPEMGIKLPEYRGYFADIDPNISNVFSAAAYRWGHSLVSSELVRMDNNGQIIREGNLDLKDAFFNPMEFVSTGGVEPFLKGMGTKMHQEMDCKVVDDIRNFLFGSPDNGGLDLVSINIMRGRERGLSDLNTIRHDIGLEPYNSWSELNSEENIAQIMQELYGDIENLDPWVGMLAEEHLEGALFGETIMRIMERQFSALRDGDRFYYENDDSFTTEEKVEIKETKFYHILMRNTDIQVMQKNVFAAIPHGEIPGSNSYVIDQDLDFKLFPNPVNEDLFFKVFNFQEEAFELRISDMSGRLIYTRTMEAEQGRSVLHIGNMNDIILPGLYHLALSNSNSYSTQIFVKN